MAQLDRTLDLTTVTIDRIQVFEVLGGGFAALLRQVSWLMCTVVWSGADAVSRQTSCSHKALTDGDYVVHDC